jgi:TBC1 domain family protein 5
VRPLFFPRLPRAPANNNPRSRWDETFRDGSGITDLQRAVKFNGPNSPCAAGLRSVCWKAFLLWRNAPAEQWPELAREARAAYSALCDQHLRFIRHPEQLAALTVDPLADDPDSPWNAVRNDETVRAEILQDVSRLPDEPFYHEEPVQTMILDILFLYCKLNPSIGGYRQGMHELLAPIVWVVAQDAVDRATALTDDPAEALLAEMLDPTFVEHDAFALFSKLMESASTFYEVESGADLEAQQRNTIVERSKYIHEVALMKIDEELANHLRNIEVLPQIFLM